MRVGLVSLLGPRVPGRPQISLKSIDGNGVILAILTAILAVLTAFFLNYCNKNLSLMLLCLWIVDKLETCVCMCVFSKKTETKIVIYALFDQYLNSSISIVIMHSE